MPVPTTLSSIEDAITLAEIALGRDSFVALVDGPTKLAMPVSGPVPPDAVERVDVILLEALGDVPGHRLVLASRRSGPPIVTEDELAQWRTLQSCHAGRALVLCDWLVFVDDGEVLSLAELAGPIAPW